MTAAVMWAAALITVLAAAAWIALDVLDRRRHHRLERDIQQAIDLLGPIGPEDHADWGQHG